MFRWIKERIEVQDRRTEELMQQFEEMQQRWLREKRRKDAIRDMERAKELYNSAQSVAKEINKEGLLNLLRLLKAQQTTEDNCDTTHRLYLSGEQYDEEEFMVKNKYRYCPRCDRFYNREHLEACYCSILNSGAIEDLLTYGE